MVELVIAFVGFSAGILDLKKVFSIALAHRGDNNHNGCYQLALLLKIRLEQSISSFIGW